MDQREIDNSLSDIARTLDKNNIDVARVRIDPALISKVLTIVVDYVNQKFHLLGELAVEKTMLLLKKLLDRFGYVMTIREEDQLRGVAARLHEVGERQFTISTPTPPAYEEPEKQKKRSLFKRIFSRKSKAVAK